MGDTARSRPGRIGGVRSCGTRLVERPRRAPAVPWEAEPPGSGWSMLACPHCGDPGPLARSGGRLACPAGHVFDLAKQGYASLLSGRGRHGLAADDAAMVIARAEVQGAGLYAPIRDAVVQAVSEAAHGGLPDAGLLDVGGGTGFYSAAVLDAASPGAGNGAASAYGVTFDLSSYAARRAAKAHPRLVSVVADVWERFPIRNASASVAMVVFAPRNGAELARVLAPGGVAVVVTPLPNHLSELADSGMIGIDPLKPQRLEQQFEAFGLVAEQEVEARVPVTARQASLIVGMGPGAYHADSDELDLAATATEGAAWAAETRDVTLAVRVATYRPPTA